MDRDELARRVARAVGFERVSRGDLAEILHMVDMRDQRLRALEEYAVGLRQQLADARKTINQASADLALEGGRIKQQITQVVGDRLGQQWVDWENTVMYVSVVNLSDRDRRQVAGALGAWAEQVRLVAAE